MENDARFLLTCRFGSNFLGQGFVVAYAVAKDLASLRSARTSDWVEMFDEIRDQKEVDESSFFLMSTKEYANLSIYLASTYSFSGFILEEPHYMLFTRQTHKDVIQESKWLTSEQIWRRTDPSRRRNRLTQLYRCECLTDSDRESERGRPRMSSIMRAYE